MITYLDVPFHESGTVRNLGAKWNMGLKKWYVPDGADHNLNIRKTKP